jgi:hypothetical protein
MMRALPDMKLFSTDLIDDMHLAFEAVCSKLGLAPTSDKVTALVVTKIVELAKAGRRGEELTKEALRFFNSPMPDSPRPTARADAEPPPRSPASL